MEVEAIKRAILELPEPDLHELETWFETIHGENVHELISAGLEQLNEGQGIPGMYPGSVCKLEKLLGWLVIPRADARLLDFTKSG